MLVSLIVAVSENGVIGKDNKLPWHLPADLQFFKKTTLGNPIIMGRKNFESIGRVLPGRTNIVLTKNKSFAAEGAVVVHSLEEAFEAARGGGAKECFVIGGAEIYKQALPFCKKLYITRIHKIFDGDTYMPEFEKGFSRASCVKNFKDDRNSCNYDFEIWEKTMRKKVFVFMGGPSTEHSVSLVSGTGMVRALDPRKYAVHPVLIAQNGEWTWGKKPLSPYQSQNFSVNFFVGAENDMQKKLRPSLEELKPIDIALIALHGRFGEDGGIQAMLEYAGVPYTGSGVLSSALAMDKIKSKEIYKANNIPTADFRVWQRENFSREAIEEAFENLGSPLVIKDPLGGSSLDMGFAKNIEEAGELCEKLFEKSPRLLAEQFITGRETTCAYIEGCPPLPPSEIIMTTRKFFDFDAKYNGEVIETTPAEFSESLTKKVQNLALKAHKALDCAAYSRTDIIIDKNENLFVLETNTLPGMTPTSFLPQQAAHIGLDYPALVEVLLEKSLTKSTGR